MNIADIMDTNINRVWKYIRIWIWIWIKLWVDGYRYGYWDISWIWIWIARIYSWIYPCRTLIRSPKPISLTNRNDQRPQLERLQLSACSKSSITTSRPGSRYRRSSCAGLPARLGGCEAVRLHLVPEALNVTASTCDEVQSADPEGGRSPTHMWTRDRQTAQRNETWFLAIYPPHMSSLFLYYDNCLGATSVEPHPCSPCFDGGAEL
jgi:hypothetical protein